MPQDTTEPTESGDVQATRTTGTRLAIAALAVLVAASAVAPAAAQPDNQEPPAEASFVVDLQADGSATVTVATAFDLTTVSEREAFEALQANQTLQDRRTDRFAERMAVIASRAGSETNREMDIRNASMAFRHADGTGVVALSVEWDGLAATDGDRVVLRQPFDGGFSADRPVRVHAPAGYRLDTVTPTPDERADGTATWAPGTDFTGFEATFVPASGGGDIAGISLGALLFGVVGSLGLLLYHRRGEQ